MTAAKFLRKRRGSVLTPAVCDMLEQRQLLATITVDTTQTLRTISPQLSGTNLATWQYELNTPKMQQLVQAGGFGLLRLPGGSASDGFHFFSPPPYNGYNTVPVMANFAQSVGANAIVTVDYGSGSPQEAAAMLAYLNASTTSTVNIGYGATWSDTSKSWSQKDFKTAGYWASLRASQPLATDDGLNFLRVNHPAPWGFTYYEIGNEEYATWEADHHSTTGVGGSSPTNYVSFAKTFDSIAQQIDPNVKTGLNVTLPLKYNMPDPNWAADVLSQSATQGLTPGFLSDHVYVTGLSDQDLLLHSVNDPNYKLDNYNSSWSSRTTFYRTLLNQYFGGSASGVKLMVTEFNSDLGTKESTSLVGGLWVADALGGLAQTEYTGALQWDLTNGYGALSAPDSTHYGWRQGVDDGLIGTGSSQGATTGAYVPYPIYFAEQLFSKIDQAGSMVVPVTSDDPNLSVYAVKETNGHVRLLVINKSSSTTINGTFNFTGFLPAASATQWQYGIAEDTAQSNTTDGSASLTTSTITPSVNNSALTQAFPAYSMSVLDLTPVPVVLPKISISSASITEGNSGTKILAIPVVLDKSSTDPVSVIYTTSNGTALAGSDYVAASGTLTFAPGQTSATISVIINGDTTVETDEQFTVTLSQPSNGTIAAATATGTIVNDDSAPVVTGTYIDAGGPAAGNFSADSGFSGGSTYSSTAAIDTSAVAKPAPQSVYQTERFGNFTYTIPNLTAGGKYNVTLDFAELYWSGAGQRVFNVSGNGSTLLSNFDIFTAAGGKNKAIAKTFIVTADTAGKIALTFTKVKDNAKVSGISITPATTTPIATSTLIDAGGPAAGSFLADGGFSGGTTYNSTSAIDTSAVTNPAPQAVYQTERFGTFTYTIANLIVGQQYSVQLDFAELYWSAAGKRVFNVTGNGAAWLSNFDIYAAAGAKNKAIARTFTANADSNGKITIGFTKLVDNAKVSGIRVTSI